MWLWLSLTLGPLALAGIVAGIIQVATRKPVGKHQATIADDPAEFEPDEDWDEEDEEDEDDDEEWEDDEDEDDDEEWEDEPVTEAFSSFDRRAYIAAQERLVVQAELELDETQQSPWLRGFLAKSAVEQWAEIAHLGVADWLPEKVAA